MKRILALSAVFVATAVLLLSQTVPVHAQLPASPSPTLTGEIELETATDSAESTSSASPASPSAEAAQRVQEKKDSDPTDPGGIQKSILAQFLEDNPPAPLSWNNFLQHGIRYAVSNGVPANTIVLILLFPLVVSFIAAARHIVGLKGFGIYTPAVLSVALVSTGIAEGILIFAAIISTALLASKVIKKVKLSYLPRTALLLWTVSLGMLGMFFLAPSLNIVTLMSVNIFPILILILLAENFLDAQTKTKQVEAIALTVETIILAFICGLFLEWQAMQQLVLSEPELFILVVAAFDLVIGKFAGLRVTERLRFRSIIEEE